MHLKSRPAPIFATPSCFFIKLSHNMLLLFIRSLKHGEKDSIKIILLDARFSSRIAADREIRYPSVLARLPRLLLAAPREWFWNGEPVSLSREPAPTGGRKSTGENFPRSAHRAKTGAVWQGPEAPPGRWQGRACSKTLKRVFEES